MHCLIDRDVYFLPMNQKNILGVDEHCLIDRDVYFLPMNQKYFRRRWALFIAYQNTAKFYP